jgi:hypothetical protein
LKLGLEPALRDLGIRGDILKTMSRAIADRGHEPDVAGLALHGDQPAESVLSGLVERSLQDELKSTAYATIDGTDGRTYHLVFSDLEVTGDARPGAIVETPIYDDDAGRKRLSLSTQSDLAIEAQVSLPRAKGEHVSGIYRQRVTLASGRFAIIDDGMRFQLAPWCPALEEQLGRRLR